MTSFLEGKLGPALLAAVLALVTVWGLWLLAPGLLDSWEGSTYDARLRLRGPAPAAEHLVLIARDSESDTRFGLGIWDRAMFARVITGLATAGASVVAVDFHFAGVSPAERGGLASDTALKE